MPRESIYKKYTPTDSPKEPTNQPSYWFIFHDYHMLVKITSTQIKIPFARNLGELNISPTRTQYLGKLEEYPCYSVEVSEKTEPREGMEFRELKSLYEFLDEDIYLLAGKAVQLVNWDKNHQFCGRCGTSTLYSDDEMAKVCPKCGYKSFVRLSPAVITAIIKDNRILMAKHGYRGQHYGLVAGFVEAGETLEEAVKRETREEVGIEVKNIKYFNSQPWPFPHSLMVGYTAEYESGEIRVDGKEITRADWFTPEDIPRIPGRVSIARDLMDWFMEKFHK